MTIAAWREFAQRGPGYLAAEVHRRFQLNLSVDQRTAVFASLSSVGEIAAYGAAGCQDGPLSGVPYVAKDLFDVRGHPTRAGSAFLGEVRPLPVRDAHLIEAFRSLGAVLVGKTHLYEFAYGLTGENPFYGNCDNPIAPGRTTGGSSSGSAAAVAAGIVPLALVTDTGGSVRVPAAYCGLYGFRQVPGHAWISDAFPLAPCCDTAGWFTRTAEDMATVLGTALNVAQSEGGVRACFLDYGRLDPEVREVCHRFAPEFAEAPDSATARELRSSITDAGEAYSVLTSREAAEIHAPWLESMRGRYSPQVWARIDRGRNWSADDLERAVETRDRLRATFEAYFKIHDALVLPAVPSAAPRHEACATYDRTRILELAAPASLAGLPVLEIPLPLNNGLSAGLQVLVRNPGDGVTLRLLHRAASVLQR